MNELKITPGPWFLGEPTEVFADNANLVLSIARCGVRFGLTYCEATANARLIAAAPDLYEALEAALECLDMTGGTEPYDSGMAALAKARGEQ